MAVQQTSSRSEGAVSLSDDKLAQLETSRPPQGAPETLRPPRTAQLPKVTGLPLVDPAITIPRAVSFESDGWISTPLLRRPSDARSNRAKFLIATAVIALPAGYFIFWNSDRPIDVAVAPQATTDLPTVELLPLREANDATSTRAIGVTIESKAEPDVQTTSLESTGRLDEKPGKSTIEPISPQSLPQATTDREANDATSTKVMDGGVRVYGITGGDAGGMTAGQLPRMVAVEPARPADTTNGEAPRHELAGAPEIPVTQDAAASAVEGKGAWEAAQGPSAPDAAGQTTGRSAPSIDPTGPDVSAPPFATAATAEPDRSEVAALLARGRSLLSNGDVAGARVLLRRAAEHNDPQAAFALGETYDPVVLKLLGVIKFNGDVVLAREWYRRAADLGSVAAGDLGRDHGAEPPERPQSMEQKTGATSQDEICKRDAAQLADLRISQGRDEVIRFERDLGCEKLRPQVIRLRESVGPQ